MVKKSLFLFCFSLICLFSCLCSFCIGSTYADDILSGYSPVYSYTGSNLGFTEWGYNTNSSAVVDFNSLTSHPSYDNAFGSFMTRFKFVLARQNVNYNTYTFYPMFNCSNRYYRLYPANLSYDYIPSDGFYNIGGSVFTGVSNLYYNSGDVIVNFSRVITLTDGYTGSSFFNQYGLICCTIYYAGSNISTLDFWNTFDSVYATAVEIGSSYNFPYGTAFNDYNFTYNGKFNFCSYHLSNDCIITFALGCYINTNDTYLWDYRLYGFADSSLQDIYYQQGFNAGLSEGNNAGYSLGYANGYNEGSNAGFNEGVASANDYSFFSLIGAVIDAPITAFKSLFNFDFLGFNMLNFVTGLITFCFVIWIVRLIL